MPPRRAVRVHIAKRSVKVPELPNALEEIQYADFREAIRMLSQVATYHVGREDNRHKVVDTSRIRELLRMNPPSFTGSSVTEDPENFIEELKRVFDVMHVAESERVELAAYQLKGVARIWFDQLKKNRAEDAPVVTWVVFESALMGHFFPRELREAKIKEFLTFNPKSISVHKYSLKFTQLSRYAPEMVADMRSRMSLYVAGLSRQSSKKGKAAMLIRDIDLARFIIHLQQVEEDKLKDREDFKDKRAKILGDEFKQQKNDANQSSLLQKQKGSAPPSASAPAPRYRDSKASLSFVTPYVAMNFDVISEQPSELFSVSTPVGEDILVREFPKVFPDNLPRIPPEKEIDVGIDFIPDAHHISFLPYRMEPEELKELEEQLRRDILDKVMAFEQGGYSVLSYYSSIQMAPYEALYGWRCRSLFEWFEVGEAGLIDPELVHHAMEKVKGVMRIGKKGKLSPRFIGPYLIVDRIGRVAYELELLQIKDSLSYEEIPVQILGRQSSQVENENVASVKLSFLKVRVSALREKRRIRGEGEEGAKFVEIVIDFIGVLGLNNLKLGRFRVGEKKEKSQAFGEKGWRIAPASVPKSVFRTFAPGVPRLAVRQSKPSELQGLATRVLQSAKDAKFSLSFPTFSCMFYGNVPMFYGCFPHSKTQVLRISIQHAVDPAELFRVSREPLCTPEDSFISKSFLLFRACTCFQSIMPPRREVRVHPSKRSVKVPELPYALEEIQYVDFREAIRMLSQVATYHVGREDNRHEVVDTSRIRELLRMNPPSFTGSSVTEDPENFIEELKSVFDVMHVAKSERVELAAYQLKGVARIWFDQWKKNREEDAPVVVWRKGGVSLLPAPSVVGTTQVFVVRDPLVVSSVVRRDISCESVQRTGRVIGAIERNLHQLLPQTGWCLEKLLLVPAEEQTASVQSMVAKSNRIHQMLSLQLSELFSVSTPVGEAILKTTEFQRSEACEESLQEWKEKLTTAQIIKMITFLHGVAYNNSYYSRIQMAPYEALYGWKCRSLFGWFEVGEAGLIDPELVHQAMEKVKGVMSIGKKGKLSPRFIGPYRIVERIDLLIWDMFPVVFPGYIYFGEKKEKSQAFGEKGWRVAPASVPKSVFRTFATGVPRLAVRHSKPSELQGLATRALQSAKDAKFSLSFPTFSCMFYGNVPMFYGCYPLSKVRLNVKNSSINM
uniref:Putative polyprotein, identical n=1 Tax=Solanum demissum TaxID=50514 RepID=Q6L435_SOLDE|nr:Putative polyprotein, identical [Solanum demissum]